MAVNYVGETATQYDVQRESARKWHAEMDIVENIVRSFEDDTTLLDIPLGTGRFLKYYSPRKHVVYGVDISDDMLAQAKPKWDECSFDAERSRMFVGDATDLKLADNEIDYVVCMRLLNWVSLEVFTAILAEFKRVSRMRVVVSIREKSRAGIHERVLAGMSEVLMSPFRVKKHYKNLLRKLYKVAFIRSLAERMTGKSINVGRLTDDNYFVHNDCDIQDVFQKLGFNVLSRTFVDQRMNYRESVFEMYYVYVLDHK